MSKENKKISDLDHADPGCPNCEGEGWVCEVHETIPWDFGDGCCGEAGTPCQCNPLSERKSILN
jgi:hypothetical protein